MACRASRCGRPASAGLAYATSWSHPGGYDSCPRHGARCAIGNRTGRCAVGPVPGCGATGGSRRSLLARARARGHGRTAPSRRPMCVSRSAPGPETCDSPSGSSRTGRRWTLEDLLDGQAWVVYAHDVEPLDPEHGGPARLLVPHLYFWKSAKWIAVFDSSTRTSRDSGRTPATTTTVTLGPSSGTTATDVASDEPRRRPAAAADETVVLAARWPMRLVVELRDVPFV